MDRLRNEAQQAARHSLPVLITGESGTGKEVFAQAVHNASIRRNNPFVRINCAAIPNELFESELFGYTKGAFTGALSEGKPGKFEISGQGTIFLDEIGEMPIEMQPKLLQVLEEKVFERVGGLMPIKADCRIIAATNQNLEEMMNRNVFRKDLYFRLNVVPIHIPPLRNHPEDIFPISLHLLEQISHDLNSGNYTVEPSAKRILMDYKWPGNVRELYNVLERTVSKIDGKNIKSEDLPFYLKSVSQTRSPDFNLGLKGIMQETERNVLLDSLSLANNNRTRAAKLLGIDRSVFYRKLKRFKIL